MGNCVIGFNNHLDSSYYQVIYSKGSWALPLTNLSDRFFVNVAESTDAANASTQFEVNFGTPRVIKLISMPEHSVKRQGRIRHRVSTVPAFTQVTLGASASQGDSSIVVQSPAGNNCPFRVGDVFKVAGSETVYTVTGTELMLGTNFASRGENLNLWGMDNIDQGDAPVVSGPDFKLSGWSLQEATTIDENHTFEFEINAFSPSFPQWVDGNICASIYAKMGQRSKCMLKIDTDDGDMTVKYDLETGTIISQDGGANPLQGIASAGIYPVGDGWFRIFITVFGQQQYSSYVNAVVFYILDDDGNDTYDGTGSKYLYVAFPQLENADSVPSRYVVNNDTTDFSLDSSGTITFTPTLAAAASSGAAVTACSGDFFSFQPVDFVNWMDVWNQAYNFGTLPFGHASFFDLKIEPEREQNYRFPYVKVYDDKIIGQFLQVQIDDTLNADGVISIGRFWVSDGWEPTYNINYGASLGWEATTEVSTGLTGAEFYDPISIGRTLRGTIDNIPEDEALQLPFEIMRDSGIDKQIFFAFNKNDTIHRHRRSFLATFRQLNPVEFPYFGVNGVPVEIKEVTA